MLELSQKLKFWENLTFFGIKIPKAFPIGATDMNMKITPSRILGKHIAATLSFQGDGLTAALGPIYLFGFF
jgi:hypothetical protein